MSNYESKKFGIFLNLNSTFSIINDDVAIVRSNLKNDFDERIEKYSFTHRVVNCQHIWNALLSSTSCLLKEKWFRFLKRRTTCSTIVVFSSIHVLSFFVQAAKDLFQPLRPFCGIFNDRIHQMINYESTGHWFKIDSTEKASKDSRRRLDRKKHLSIDFDLKKFKFSLPSCAQYVMLMTLSLWLWGWLGLRLS